MTREWNGDEITQLRSLAGTQSARQIALVLGRTRHAVKQQMKRLRICVDRAPEWTPTEIEQLRELARTKSCMQASMELKRGRTSVHWKAAQLGVIFAKKTPRVKESKKALRFWTLEERSLLREMAPKLSMHELARVTGRSVSAVEHMTAKLGLQVAYSKPKPVKAEKSNTRKPVAGCRRPASDWARDDHGSQNRLLRGLLGSRRRNARGLGEALRACGLQSKGEASVTDIFEFDDQAEPVEIERAEIEPVSLGAALIEAAIEAVIAAIDDDVPPAGTACAGCKSLGHWCSAKCYRGEDTPLCRACADGMTIPCLPCAM